MHNITFPLSSVAQTLAKRSPFNAETDFAGVSIAVYVPFVITAHPSVPAKDLRELGALLQNKALQYNYGSTGPGSAMHVIGETFKRDAKVDMAHIAFKGAAPLKLELLSGRIQFGGDQLSTSLAEIRAGTVEGARDQRREAHRRSCPTCPPCASRASRRWNSKAGTACSRRQKRRVRVIDRLQREAAAAVRHPEVPKRFADLGAEPVGSSSPTRTRSCSARWSSSGPSLLT